MTDETLPEPVLVPVAKIINRPALALRTIQWIGDPGSIPDGEYIYTAATLREAVKRANYALLMRLHEENKHKHNFFHCAAVKLMEDKQ